MSKVYIQDKQLWKDGTIIPLTSAEVHYWRLEPEYWRPVLQGAIDMGMKTIASYVQWHYHEYEEGKFDFTGQTDPKRNLVRHIELVQEMDLNLIVRPGPYTFAEWNNYGVPDYVIPYNRLHPKFLEAASRWIDAVCAVIRPCLATNDGPIVMVQADNMFDVGQKRYDRQLGFYGGDGSYQHFLQNKYGDISKLNQAWGTDYKMFDQAMATMVITQPDAATHNRWLDFQEFKHWFTNEAARWTVAQLRKNQIDVPIHSNATKDQNPVDISKILDVLAFNHYPTINYSMVADEHRHLLDHVRLLSTVSPLPYIVELESGIWHGYHYTKGLPTKPHYRYMLLTILAGGAVTWTWYMLHDRDNWYMSPLNSRGLKRTEVFSLFKQFIELEARTKPYTWKRCSHSGLTYYPLHGQNNFSELEYASVDASGALYATGIDYSFYSLQSPGDAPDILFYNGERWLEDKAQKVLLDYMDQGGNLVIFQQYPYLDKYAQPCNKLKIPYPDGVESQGYMNTFYKDLEIQLGDFSARVKVPASVYLYSGVPGHPIEATHILPEDEVNDNVLEEYQFMVYQGIGNRITIGYHEKRGQGSLTVLGVPPSSELITALHAYLGVDIPAKPDVAGIQAILYRTENSHYLLVLNNGSESKGTQIQLSKNEFGDGMYQVNNLLDRQEYVTRLEGNTSRTIMVQVPNKNGVLLEIHPV